MSSLFKKDLFDIFWYLDSQKCTKPHHCYLQSVSRRMCDRCRLRWIVGSALEEVEDLTIEQKKFDVVAYIQKNWDKINPVIDLDESNE